MTAELIESLRADLAPQADRRRYLLPLAWGLVAEVLSAGLCSIAAGIIGFGLVRGFRPGGVPAGRLVVVAALGVLAVAVAVVVGALVSAALLRRERLPARHARAVGALFAGATALGWLVPAGVLGGGSLGQWLGALLGTSVGVAVALALLRVADAE